MLSASRRSALAREERSTSLGEVQAESLREEITVLELKCLGPHGASDSLDASNKDFHPELKAVVERWSKVAQ